MTYFDTHDLVGQLYAVWPGETYTQSQVQDDVIKWKHFPRYRPFVRGIHRSPVNSPHKDQWHGALMFSLICAWTNGWVNNRDTGDLTRHRAHYDVIVMNLRNLEKHRLLAVIIVSVADDLASLYARASAGTVMGPAQKIASNEYSVTHFNIWDTLVNIWTQ